MNDVELRWNKIKSFEDEFHNVVEDRHYTKEEIKLLVDRSDLRNKAIILLMASSGLRIGAIPELRFRDPSFLYCCFTVFCMKYIANLSRYLRLYFLSKLEAFALSISSAVYISPIPYV